jgi:alpha-tubulin suppressor-like RCC1 family protein
VAVSASNYESMALLGNGTVMTWGDNTYGELGNDTVSSHSNVPVVVKGLAGVTAISAGFLFNLALLRNGTVRAWGENQSGQLGNGVDSNVSHQLIYRSPVPVAGLTGVEEISAGVNESLALLRNGTVMAWGIFDVAATPGHNVPVAVHGLSGVKAVSSSLYENLALLTNGTVMIWSTSPEYGTAPGSGTNAPVKVKGLSKVIAVSAGQGQYLALLRSGSVMAWGDNQYGELGNGTNVNSTTPVAVKGLSKVSAVSAGGYFNLALLRNGTVRAWGENTYGSLGDNKIDGNSNVPVLVHGLSGVKVISAGTVAAFASQAARKAMRAEEVG